MLTELSRREKAANIKPDADIDMYMKVSDQVTKYSIFYFLLQTTSLEGQEYVVTDYILKVLSF